MATKAKTLLLVDQNPDEAKKLAGKLITYGYSVMHAFSAGDAIETYQANHDSIDLILMAIELGGERDGIDVAREILDANLVPIVFLSSRNDMSLVEKTETVSTYGYVWKSAGIPKLVASIKVAFRLHDSIKSNLEKSAALLAANDALRLSEEKYRTLFETSPDGIVILDRDGVVIDINNAHGLLTGYNRDEVINLHFSEFPNVIKENVPRYHEIFSELAAGRTIINREVMLRHKNGEIKIFDFSMAPLRDSGRGEALQVVMRDITERVRTREELEKSLQVKEVLMRELRHRVKNSFSTVMSLLSLKMSDLPDDLTRGIIKDVMNRIRTISIVYDKLSFSADIDSINLSTYIQDLVSSLYNTLSIDEQRVRLVLSVAEIQFDAKRAMPLGLIINELVTNVFKYAYPRGAAGKMRVILEKSGNDVILTVSDDGMGLPEGFSTDTHAGLGLTIITALARQINGVFSLEGGRGTTARVSFPLLGYQQAV